MSPKEFDMCKKEGGKIRTKKLGQGKFQHICVLDGQTFMGEVKIAKSSAKATKGAFVRAGEKEDLTQV